MPTRIRPAGALPFLALLVLSQLCLPRSPAVAAAHLLEELHYRLAILAWQDAARVRFTLKRQESGRLVAEVTGEPQGIFKVLSGGQRERLETEMVWRDHRLQPLRYREESWRGKKRRFKEYRFNYSQNRLELWEWHQGKGLSPKWHTDLTSQVYDPLSAFYNIRLGAIKPNRAGETGTIAGIPYPRPESMEVRLGAATDAGLKAMVSLFNSVFPDSRGEVYAYLNKHLVPTEAWTTVAGVTLKARLQPQSVIMSSPPAKLPAPGQDAPGAPPPESSPGVPPEETR